MMLSLVLSIDIGVITVFAGGIGNIPSGWFLCDGSNGTPDLRAKFVVSAGPLFAVGNEGGSFGHGHDFTGDGHTHDLQEGSDLGGTAMIDTTTNSESIVGRTGNAFNIPPLYALAFIQYRGV